MLSYGLAIHCYSFQQIFPMRYEAVQRLLVENPNLPLDDIIEMLCIVGQSQATQ